MTAYDNVKAELKAQPRSWLVTGSAGFIGSALVEALLGLGQKVTGLDDLSSGSGKTPATPGDFTFIKGDIRDADIAARACKNVDVVLHHAAIASVVKSLEDPALVDSVNGSGFLSMLMAAKDAGVKRFIYASSSAVYGDGGEAPRKESDTLSPASPYAVSKRANETEAKILGDHYGIETVGFRYFNVYGPNQDPNGAYAAVIAKWIEALDKGEAVQIFGDGKTIRDFCHIDDVVQANLLAAAGKAPAHEVYNIGSGEKTSLNDLYQILRGLIPGDTKPVYKDFRAADIRISCADIAKAKSKLGFSPGHNLASGLESVIKRQRAAA